MSVLYCYTRQRRAVESHMFAMGITPSSRNPRCIDDNTMHEIQGLRDVQFIEITTHPDTPPARMMAFLRDCGVTFITVDDRYARERYYHDRGRQ